MIQRTSAFKTSDGKTFDKLEDAKTSEVATVFSELMTGEEALCAAKRIVDNADAIVDILTTKEGSLVRARKINGGRKKRVTQVAQGPEVKFE